MGRKSIRVRPHWSNALVAALVAAVGPAALPAVVAAQSGHPAADAATLDAMKGDLRRVVSATAVYRSRHATYATSLADLPTFHTTTGVSITFVSVTANGWAASATAAALPGKSCVIFIGTVPAPPKTDGQETGPEGVATCDRP